MATSTFLWLSDLHYDPYYGMDGAYGRRGTEFCAESTDKVFGQYFCDASEELIRSAATSAVSMFPNSDFVVVTGDFSRHGTDQLKNPVQELGEILAKITKILHDVFDSDRDEEKSLSIIPTLGNNDFTPDYYINITERPNALLAVAADAFSGTLISQSEEETFREGGYLSRNVSDTLTILSINTLVYCNFHEPEQFDIEDPFDQFSWLEIQLSMARLASRRVYIVGHIPPAIGSYKKEQYWAEGYRRRFTRLVSGQYADVVAAQMYGHQHSDEFRAFPYQQEDDGVVILAPSITPLFGNNPSFRAVTYDDRARILDYVTYYTDLSEVSQSLSWKKLYSFIEQYNVSDVSVQSFRKILDSITDAAENGDDNPTLEKVLRYQHVDTGHNTCVGRCQFEWVCVLQAGSSDDYDACLDALTSNGNNITIFVAMIVIAILGGGAIIYVIIRRCRIIKTGIQYQMPEINETGIDMNYDDEIHDTGNTDDEIHDIGNTEHQITDATSGDPIQPAAPIV
mmetsp:Transcript_5485/g.8363  ORF Transcript_5485/g.8363 Transcript_5485/m.8363 type:complete len:511 (+) Transcript_5485:118-1650(+)